MRTRSQTGFAALQTEGAILPADLLRRIAEGDSSLGGLDPASYHLPAGERLSEAVSRSWSRLQGSWAAFKAAGERLPEADAGTTLTREKWLLPLFQELGYGRLTPTKPITIGEKSYGMSHGWQHTPLHLVSFRLDLDKRQAGAAGASKTSPHSLVQEFLNRSEEHLWGIVSNGLRLRILRDNASLSRQAFVEFDVEAIFDGELYADFALLWLLCHQSRVETEEAEACWLEKWSKAAKEQGTRALDTLRDGVEKAIARLGSGFITHSANGRLRERLRSGTLSPQDYYRELLRHVYRLLFLFVAEDRDLLLAPGATPDARNRFERFFSTRRLRLQALRLRGGRHGDLFAAFRLVVQWLSSDAGRPEVGLPPLGSALFSPAAVPETAACEIANRDFLAAVRDISVTAAGPVRRSVDYRNLGSEELGSVYESLLELHPHLDLATGAFELGSAAGNERKTTGSYYTPASLVKRLLDSALEPVLGEAVRAKDPEAAILDLKVCDPACGSGHFLIAAAHRMAHRLSFLRAGSAEPPPELVRAALREVVGRCLYGVDVNPMAVELCKVALWMEALEPGKPLSFLDHHIRCGSSLLGVTPALLEAGIPDEAFDPIEGDNKALCRELKKRNKQERTSGQRAFLAAPAVEDLASSVREGLLAIGAIDDTTLEGVRARERRWNQAEASETMKEARLAADAWCAAFVWQKRSEGPLPLTTGQLATLGEGDAGLAAETRREIVRLAEEHRFFHWYLAFPDVFAVNEADRVSRNPQAGWFGGFDVVLGNPPWDQIQFDDSEFFSTTAPTIAATTNTSQRKRLIAELQTTRPDVFAQYEEAVRVNDGTKRFVHDSGRYPLTSFGRLNLAPLFLELARSIVANRGRIGFIVPAGIATDSFNQYFFRDLVSTRALVSLLGFENEEFLFPGVHHATKFCLLTLSGGKVTTDAADFVFFARAVEELEDETRHFSLAEDDLRLFNPNTRTCPIFRTKRDAELTRAVYRHVPVLLDKAKGGVGDPWRFSGMLMFMMNTDSSVFRERASLEAKGMKLEGNVFVKEAERYLPLYEAKMLHIYDSRFGTYQGQTEAQANQGKLPELSNEAHADAAMVPLPKYWVPEADVERRLQGKWDRQWLLGFRDITGAVVQRTVIASPIPRVGVGNQFPIVLFEPISLAGVLTANLSSYVFDFVARQKVGGTHLNFFIFEQLPVLPPGAYGEATPWSKGTSMATWLTSRVLELTYTGRDLAGFAFDLGYSGPPFRWEEDRRFLIRCEIDAAFFHLYGIASEDVDYIMDTFPIVRRNDEREHGEYRTKRVILEIFDEMAAAMRSGGAFQSRLDPPPGDPDAAHSAVARGPAEYFTEEQT